MHTRGPDLNGDVGTVTVRSVVGSYVLINDQLPSLVAFQACIRSWRRPKATRQRVEGRQACIRSCDACLLVRTLDFLQGLLATPRALEAGGTVHVRTCYLGPAIPGRIIYTPTCWLLPAVVLAWKCDVHAGVNASHMQPGGT
jgi:hypothetical protein